MRLLIPLFTFTLFSSAGLLFVVQPMIGKAVLPWLGGTPAVWNTCMLFFQIMVLAGYGYAHILSRFSGNWPAVLLHLIILATGWWLLPFPFDAPLATLPSPDAPATWLLRFLFSTAGLPFFALATSAPLLQSWFSRTTHPAARDPYFLYVASNIGSLGALLAYPLLIEPHWPLSTHNLAFRWAFAGFWFLTAACTLMAWRFQAPARGATDEPIARYQDRPRTEGETPQDGRETDFETDKVSGLAKEGLLRQRPTGGQTIRLDPGGDPQFETTSERGIAGAALPAPSWRQIGFWVFAAAVPSSLMLGVTTHISTNVASFPLLWVLPLVLYLLTFIIAFLSKPLISPEGAGRGFVVLLVVMPPALLWNERLPIVLLMLLHLAFFFAAALLCHAQLAARRPPTTHLTAFYLALSLGGALGGLANALLAPTLFLEILEYPAAMVLCCLCLPSRLEKSSPNFFPKDANEASPHKRDIPSLPGGRWRDPVTATLTLIMVAAIEGNRIGALPPLSFHLLFLPTIVWSAGFVLSKRRSRWVVGFLLGCLLLFSHHLRRTHGGLEIELVTRNFYGVKRVIRDSTHGIRRLMHGDTMHGTQRLDETGPAEPLAYYRRDGPMGEVLATIIAQQPDATIGLVGLGVGSLAAYATETTRMTFFEIDPEVIELAENPRFFRFLPETKGQLTMRTGDGRLTLAQEPDRSFDLLILDAFSSDAIPTHLMTLEAIQMYVTKLRPDGILIFHISNRYFNLEPALAALAKHIGLSPLVRTDPGTRDAFEQAGIAPSKALVMGSEAALARLSALDRWGEPSTRHRKIEAAIWTDSFAPLLSLLL
jgi:spermidine synthase